MLSSAVKSEQTHAPPEQIEMWIESLCAPFRSRVGLNDYGANDGKDRFTSKARRELEFATGRRFAESLLKRLGNSQQVWSNDDRSPLWPAGFAGSISHSQTWTWTVVGKQTDFESAGIDTETVVSAETRAQIVFEIATKDEWNVLAELNLTPEQIFSVAFSAKEAFYKCCYPRVKTYFGFEHASIVAATANCIQIRTHESHPCFGAMPKSLEVHYLVSEKDVFTATWLEPCQ